MKRDMTREELGFGIKGLDMAKCLMLLSCGMQTKTCSSSNDVFECKTCNRKFASFQALGGHRASHKRPRRSTSHDDEDCKNEPEKRSDKLGVTNKKAKTHECSICGSKFGMGQALGGHMRRHKASNMNTVSFPHAPSVVSSKIPVLTRSNSKRVMSLEMDLNLTPLENDLKLLFGKMAPKVDAFAS
ncbi:zinc finger protein ZAT11-like [Pyrus communis]|uniref:zinc finger protein ZAT11-like n=1 Tax=Pyrus communis TaxID=23211 RepID=UPI0035C08F2B